MKTFFTLVIIAVVILAGVTLWLMRDQATAPVTGVSEPITLQGEIVCLPHRDSSGPQTLECAYGLLSADNEYYLLNDEIATSGPSKITDIPTGSVVEVSGSFVAGEDEQYATIGTITFNRLDVTEEASALDETHSDGTITFTTPEDFGLAVSEEQVLSSTVIPPCESGFAYCLYSIGSEYTDTNFESAGIGIFSQDEAETVTTCLENPPAGYADMSPAALATTSTYAISVFSPILDAGAGHYSNGEEYRLFTNGTCYQIVQRIGESQFENYPTGTVEKFTETDRETLMDTLRSIISSFTLNETGEQLVLPE